MCRHLAYLGPPVALADIVTRPPNGLYEQSWAPRRQRNGTVNADGFGLGWYPGGDSEPASGVGSGAESQARPESEPAAESQAGLPARYRRAVPIWADPNLPDLTRAIRSPAVLAAVRDATEGTAQDETAAAPYADGRWLFSHNGAVPDWERLVEDLAERIEARELLGLEARCDSALLWALLSRRLREGESAEDALASLTARTAAIRPGARLNFLLTDGRTIFATRCGDTLWYRTGPQSVCVASEPDSAGSGVQHGARHRAHHGAGAHHGDAVGELEGSWQEVPDGSLLVATASTVRTVPLVPLTALPPAEDAGSIHARRT
jgi:predicted glutamine amidotransferase